MNQKEFSNIADALYDLDARGLIFAIRDLNGPTLVIRPREEGETYLIDTLTAPGSAMLRVRKNGGESNG